jgi:hypothetical protein
LRNKGEYETIIKNSIMKKVIIQFSFPGLPVSKLDKAWEECRAKGYSNPKGLLHHVGGIQGNNLIVVDVWESEAAFNKFGEILLPILNKLGFPNVKPVITPVHYEYNGLSIGLAGKKAA